MNSFWKRSNVGKHQSASLEVSTEPKREPTEKKKQTPEHTNASMTIKGYPYNDETCILEQPRNTMGNITPSVKPPVTVPPQRIKAIPHSEANNRRSTVQAATTTPPHL
uniref:Klf11_0 protein n=1 Tax=Fopius arisanus TaxID=64838 RepID=A0A0C9RNV1_9HYME